LIPVMETHNSSSSLKREHSRHGQRIYAFQVLYSLKFNPAESQVQTTFEHFLDENQGRESQYALELVQGVLQRLEELDAVIGSYSRNWRVERIALVELTIMRLALFEMLYRPDIPVKVAINEGIELAKTFGDEGSSNFVNGVLDAAAKDVRNGKLRTDKRP